VGQAIVRLRLPVVVAVLILGPDPAAAQRGPFMTSTALLLLYRLSLPP
jgi:hypothetical protein